LELSNRRALLGADCRFGQGRRVVRDKNQKGFRATADAEPRAKASEIHCEEIHAQSITNAFAKAEEGLADSIPKSDTGNKVKTRKKVSHS
jgi:hypothetical protein